MILPTKHIKLENSLLGASAEILKRLSAGQTVTSLWNDVRTLPGMRTYARFTLTLDFLYTVGAVELHEGLLQRVLT